MEIIPFVQRVTGVITCVGLIVFGVGVYLQLSVDPAGERYVVFFNESVDGLSKGAKVTYDGLEVGYVESIHPISDPTHEMAGSIAVVFVVKEESLQQIVVNSEPALDDYHPWVTWVDPALSPTERTAGLLRHDWVLSIDGRPIVTVAELEDEIDDALSRHTEISGQVLYTLRIRRAGEERDVEVRRRELPYSFSEGGTRVTMAQNLVTQIRHIALISGHPGLPRLRGKSTREPLVLAQLPRIETTETGLSQLTRLIQKKLPSILRSVDEVTANLAELTRELTTQTDTLDEILLNIRDLTDPDSDIGTIMAEGARSFESARRSLERIEGQLAAGGQLYEALSNLQRLLADEGEVVATLHEVQDMMATLNDQFDEGSEIHQVLTDASETLVAIRETVDGVKGYLEEDGEVRHLLTNANETMDDLQESMSGTGRVGGTLDDVRYTLRNDLRPTLRALTESMRKLQETMERYNANPGVTSGRAQPRD